MLLPGTQMHIVTFIFVCIEIVIFFYLLIYRLSRPDDQTGFLNVILISLLIVYNVTGGLLPDPNLPGSKFLQESIAYATGFITPCYFPYYVFKAFGLEKMKFHAYPGVFLFLMLPYFVFILAYAISGSLDDAKNFLFLPVLYAVWVIYTLWKSIRHKYRDSFTSHDSREEIIVLMLSISPWIGLPFIAYFNLNQATEASITNTGFLLLLALHVKRHIMQMRVEHEKLITSEKQLVNWNINLKSEVEKRTKELEKINEQRTNTFVNLAHETKTPLTLINNYLEEYINKKGNSEELTVVKKSIDKLSADIINFFDLERFNKGFSVYDHNQICNFSEILSDSLVLFKVYSLKKKIEIHQNIEKDIFTKADPVSINRIINNLIENAIKFSEEKGIIQVLLRIEEDRIIFSVIDCGIGIPQDMHKKIFAPYYQIANQKKSIQGMGLGLPIVNRVVQDLQGQIKIDSNPQTKEGTKITIILNKHLLQENERVTSVAVTNILGTLTQIDLEESIYNEEKQTILLVEDNVSMLNYLGQKLQIKYNVYIALNGNTALKKMKEKRIPDLIISDVMMDVLDGFSFAKIISENPLYKHIPLIFLSAKSSKPDKLKGLKLGAIDFIQKPFSINELLQKVESVLSNTFSQKQLLLSAAFNSIASAESMRGQKALERFEQNCQLYNLTAREKDIIKLIREGVTYNTIAESLFIAERTVTKHVQNIFEKLEVSNKIELINKLES